MPAYPARRIFGIMTPQNPLNINPRRAGGGVFTPPPSQVFAHLILHILHIGCQNFSSRSSKVRSPGQVKWHNLRENSSTPPCYIFAISIDRSRWNLQGLLRLTGYKKCISRIFYIYDRRSGQFCDLPIISQWEKFHFIFVCVKTTISSQRWNEISPIDL